MSSTLARALAAGLAYTPPAPKPPRRELPYGSFVWLSNAIEAWPAAVYERPYYRPPWPYTPLLLCEPEAIRTLLLDEVAVFPRAEVIRRMFGPIWGNGLFTAENEAWRWQRHAAAPAFRPDRVLSMVPDMTAAAEAALTRWREAGDGARIDVAAAMTRTTFDVILETALSGGEDFGDLAEASRRIAAFVNNAGRVHARDMLPIPEWMRTPEHRRGGPTMVYMRETVGRMVARRRKQGPGRGDLVDLLMTSADPQTGEGMDDTVLRDNLIGFIAAGHETTAQALTWSLYLIGSHPPTEARMLAEIAAVAGDAPITAAHIERLVFTKQVLQEAMRLYPPAPILVTRQAQRDIEVAGYRIRKGTLVSVPVYALHRHRAYWRDPDVFDPDRFAPETGLDKQRYLYMPFGAGPRICIGATFATIEATAILATLVRGMHLEPDPTHKIRPMLRASLWPQGGMPMTLRFRR